MLTLSLLTSEKLCVFMMAIFLSSPSTYICTSLLPQGRLGTLYTIDMLYCRTRERGGVRREGWGCGHLPSDTSRDETLSVTAL